MMTTATDRESHRPRPRPGARSPLEGLSAFRHAAGPGNRRGAGGPRPRRVGPSGSAPVNCPGHAGGPAQGGGPRDAGGDDRRAGGGGQEHGLAAAGRAARLAAAGHRGDVPRRRPWPRSAPGPTSATTTALGDLAARVSVEAAARAASCSTARTSPRLVRASRSPAPPARGRQPERPPPAGRSWQREFAAENDVVAEGRDQGTVVFPDALRKFFLTASLDERARRRHAEFAARGEPIAARGRPPRPARPRRPRRRPRRSPR